MHSPCDKTHIKGFYIISSIYIQCTVCPALPNCINLLKMNISYQKQKYSACTLISTHSTKQARQSQTKNDNTSYKEHNRVGIKVGVTAISNLSVVSLSCLQLTGTMASNYGIQLVYIMHTQIGYA